VKHIFIIYIKHTALSCLVTVRALLYPYLLTKYRYRIDIAIFCQCRIDIVSKLKSWYRVITNLCCCCYIADHTAYDVRYYWRPLSGIAVVSMSILTYLQFQAKVCFWCSSPSVSFLADRCVLWLTIQIRLKKWIGSAVQGTWWYNVQPPTLGDV